MDPDGNMEWFDGLIRRGIRPGLDNTLELLRRLGDPHVGMRLIHVAGTDGKGSVCAMIESILKCSGMRVGAFTSPHILDVNECIRLEGDDIPERELMQIFGMIRPHVEDMSREGMECTNFEVLTVAALLYFRTVSVDIAVIEVGMGGTLDCTNVITPEVVVINNVGMEHTEWLGDTIEKVASQKAGIMKPGVPCVTINPDRVYSVLEEHAAEVGCPIRRILEKDVSIMACWPECVDFVYEERSYTVYLPGRHQARNAALAIEAVRLLPEYDDVIEGHVSEGLESVSWPCRMQKLIAEPIIIDVTHTVNGARCLSSDIAEIYGKVVLVLGMLGDKDIDGVTAELSKVAEKVFITAPHSPRASSPEATADVASVNMHVDGVFGTVAKAMEEALRVRGDLNVLVTGSFRTAEDVLRWLQSRYARS